MACAMQNVFNQDFSTEGEVYRSLWKLQLSLTNHFCLYLTDGGRKEAQATRDIENERMDKSNWENSEKIELEIASFILKQMKRALEEECQNGMEISTRESLMNLFSHLWTYFLLSGGEGTQRVSTLRHFHDQETESRVKDDCEVVIHFLEQQTALLHHNSSSGEGSRFNQSLNRMLRYLKQLTGRGTRPLSQTSYDEDKGLEELDWILR